MGADLDGLDPAAPKDEGFLFSRHPPAWPEPLEQRQVGCENRSREYSPVLLPRKFTLSRRWLGEAQRLLQIEEGPLVISNFRFHISNLKFRNPCLTAGRRIPNSAIKQETHRSCLEAGRGRKTQLELGTARGIG